jgi:hypothetical protein
MTQNLSATGHHSKLYDYGERLKHFLLGKERVDMVPNLSIMMVSTSVAIVLYETEWLDITSINNGLMPLNTDTSFMWSLNSKGYIENTTSKLSRSLMMRLLYEKKL